MCNIAHSLQFIEPLSSKLLETRSLSGERVSIYLLYCFPLPKCLLWATIIDKYLATPVPLDLIEQSFYVQSVDKQALLQSQYSA